MAITKIPDRPAALAGAGRKVLLLLASLKYRFGRPEMVFDSEASIASSQDKDHRPPQSFGPCG
jgi:hypothetical protein